MVLIEGLTKSAQYMANIISQYQVMQYLYHNKLQNITNISPKCFIWLWYIIFKIKEPRNLKMCKSSDFVIIILNWTNFSFVFVSYFVFSVLFLTFLTIVWKTSYLQLFKLWNILWNGTYRVETVVNIAIILLQYYTPTYRNVFLNILQVWAPHSGCVSGLLYVFNNQICD